MHEEIINRLRAGGGISSEALAREFFKFKNPDVTLAHTALAGILGKDQRCFFGNDGLWHASAMASRGDAKDAFQDLRSIPWRAVHVLTGGEGPSKKLFHVSVWSLFPTPAPCFNEWLENPHTLPYEEQLTLVSPADEPFCENAANERAKTLTKLCAGGAAIFLSGNQISTVQRFTESQGFAFPENTILIRQLFIAAQIPAPKTLTLEVCHTMLFGRGPSRVDARTFGEILAECAAELIDRCITGGITTMGDLDAAERTIIASFDFSSKAFSFRDIESLPQRPGVYAFKNKADEYIYIGKAGNLRRRIMSYFRDSDESPEKLDRLRRDAHSLITSPCGSELESLIYEYRLIRKHAPSLNVKTTINERKGQFRSIDDCIILLPHAEENKGMSFWFRRNQKIALKPFAPHGTPTTEFIDELDRFFFSPTLPASTTDFPEQEIAIRWIKSHDEDLVKIPVTRMKNALEIANAFRGYWDEVPTSMSRGTPSTLLSGEETKRA